jgi:hypothetical protein
MKLKQHREDVKLLRDMWPIKSAGGIADRYLRLILMAERSFKGRQYWDEFKDIERKILKDAKL